MEYEWLQVSSGLPDSSEYSQQRCSLEVLNSSSDFKFFQSFFQSFGNHSVYTNYNYYLLSEAFRPNFLDLLMLLLCHLIT